MSLRHSARDLHEDLVRLRRSLHREPEVGLALPRTRDRVLAALEGLPLEVSTGTRATSVTAVLRGARPGPTVLLRGDMDGLPVDERGDVPYASRVPGRMHACGHDMHTAMLAGAAHLLSAVRENLAGSVVFAFQPGEEGHHGARVMLEEGLLDASGERPVAAYGLHVMSAGLPAGVFLSRGGTIMASGDTLRVTVRGAGGHGSTPYRAQDPVPAACEMVVALQAMVTRTFDVFDPVVLSVCRLRAGEADNVIPDTASFTATIRCFSATARAAVRDHAARLLRGVADAHGLGVDVEFEAIFPVTVNDGAETGFAAETVREAFGEERYAEAAQPFSGSEDFSYMLQEVPGAFVALGACPVDRDPARAPFNHSPEAVFDDAVLSDGAGLYAELAARRLSRAAAEAAG